MVSIDNRGFRYPGRNIFFDQFLDSLSGVSRGSGEVDNVRRYPFGKDTMNAHSVLRGLIPFDREDCGKVSYHIAPAESAGLEIGEWKENNLIDINVDYLPKMHSNLFANIYSGITIGASGEKVGEDIPVGKVRWQQDAMFLAGSLSFDSVTQLLFAVDDVQRDIHVIDRDGKDVRIKHDTGVVYAGGDINYDSETGRSTYYLVRERETGISDSLYIVDAVDMDWDAALPWNSKQYRVMFQYRDDDRGPDQEAVFRDTWEMDMSWWELKEGVLRDILFLKNGRVLLLGDAIEYDSQFVLEHPRRLIIVMQAYLNKEDRTINVHEDYLVRLDLRNSAWVYRGSISVLNAEPDAPIMVNLITSEGFQSEGAKLKSHRVLIDNLSQRGKTLVEYGGEMLNDGVFMYQDSTICRWNVDEITLYQGDGVDIDAILASVTSVDEQLDKKAAASSLQQRKIWSRIITALLIFAF